MSTTTECGDRALPARLRNVGYGAVLTLLTGLIGCTDAEREAPPSASSSPSNTPSNTQSSTPAQPSSTPASRVRIGEPGLLPATEQRQGDAARGARALLDEAYVSCGLPLDAYRSLLGNTPVLPAPGRTGTAATLPYYTNLVRDDNGVEIVANNCLTCHGASLFGELVIGLGNEFLDSTRDPAVAVERAGLVVSGEAETAAWARYAERIGAIAPYMQMPIVGVNPANNLTFALIAHRDPETNAWLDTPALPVPDTDPPPVSVPPWWRMAKKHAMFNTGEGRGDHARIMMAAAILCTDSIEALEAIDRYTPDLRSYLASLAPPRWPFAIDTTLAAEGRRLFEATCSECHGTYGDTPSYPNRLVAIELIGTDRRLMDYNQGERALAWAAWFNASYFGRLAEAVPGKGYVAPPLDGIWATGPYLHNGSVPSLSLMLDSRARPTAWQRLARSSDDPADFDRETVGWRWAEADVETLPAPGDADAIWFYDTRRHGYGNGGHTFGDAFTDAERRAVVEYLKTL